MVDNFQEIAEEANALRPKANNNSIMMFSTKGSAGRNPQKLAQICAIWGFTMLLMGWDKKPLANLPLFLTQYQASIDAKYHNDYKDVLVAEEIERKRANRKGISILQGGEK